MLIFDVQGNWKVMTDTRNVQIPIDLEISYDHTIANLQASNNFDTGWYYYDENYIIITLNNHSGDNNTLLVGMLSGNGQLEGAFENFSQGTPGIWAASKSDNVKIDLIQNQKIENYNLIGKTFNDDRSCALCPFGASYTFSNPSGSNGTLRKVELKILGTDLSMEGNYFTTKFNQEGPQFVGMNFPVPGSSAGFSLGGVLEVEDGRVVINGLSMNPDANTYSKWRALEW